jgi:signal transduction histidine kinase
MKVLVVDDEKLARTYATHILKSRFYEPVQASDASEALDILEKEEISIVLCDIMMPGMSGIALLRHIRATAPQVAVIMMTSVDSPERAALAIECGAYAYLVKPFEPNELIIGIQSSLQRQRLERQQWNYKERLEANLLEKTREIRLALEEANDARELLHGSLNSLDACMAIIDESGRLVMRNRQWQEINCSDALLGDRFQIGDNYLEELEQNLGTKDAKRVAGGIRQVLEGKQKIFALEQVHNHVDRPRYYRLKVTRFSNQDRPYLVVAFEDITANKVLESQLAQSQKLESVGQLAAGVAHEINTPMQYVGNNLDYLRNSFSFISKLLNELSDEQREATLQPAQTAGGPVPEKDHSAGLKQTVKLDLQRLQNQSTLEQIDEAIGDSLEGVQHVCRIVNAMKQFAHPGYEEKTSVDINAALYSTITVSTNEWKYVAEVETDFEEDLPLVPALAGELNQVFLNLIINAAHAIEDAYAKDPTIARTIKVSTRSAERSVVITIADTGCGIPESIRTQVFDPFFTTKEVGKGTGQGLAIAHSVIAKKHGGRLWFQSTENVGTKFHIELPTMVECNSKSQQTEPETEWSS